MAGLRELHRSDPQKYTREFLSAKFRVSNEAVRRILRSSWRETLGEKAVVNVDEAMPASQTHAKENKEHPTKGTKWDIDTTTSESLSTVLTIAKELETQRALSREE
jgi:hypothetical protein